ncbi:MAG: signal recognition particle protein [Firmicutes bacterium]|nr:signal recognition particle protein [Bacillota bacterium]
MFSSLAEKLQNTLRKLRGKGRLSEKDVDAALREIRLTLLEADVNFKVVKDFVGGIRERAVGEDVRQSLTPGQQVVKIVHEELTALMGREQSKINTAGSPAVLMLAGLQGSGKTTTAVKLALNLKRSGYNPLLAAADIYRPGAPEQLQVLGDTAGIPCFRKDDAGPVVICREAVRFAAREGHDPVILDTAGRLHLDDAMMDELKEIKAQLKPSELLLVVDAMTGQDAVNAASAFHEALGLTGVILTKLDGDTRGGAALSVRAVAGCPIKFAGVGEKLDALEPFHPERMASRILGMGDVLSLIEKAEASFDEQKARDLEKKLLRQEFTLDDFREQLQQMGKIGSVEEIMAMLPAAQLPKGMRNLSVDEKQFKRIEAVITSMTPEERRRPTIINSSRRRRIALGSGTTVQDVNRLLTQFSQMQKLFKQVGSPGKKGLKRIKKGKKGFPFL